MTDMCDRMMISIDEYAARHGNRPGEVADVLLRQLPEAVARWRSEQPEPCGRLLKECVMVDDATGWVEIVAVGGDGGSVAVSDLDDVKDYGAIASSVLAMLPHTPARVVRFVDACRRGEYASMGDVMLAVERRKSDSIYILLIILLAALMSLLLLLSQ